MNQWHFCHFGLLVTGRGEAEFLPNFLRALTQTGHCTFEVIRKFEQRAPKSSKKALRANGSQKNLPDRDTRDFGFPAREYVHRSENHFVLLVDDLEHATVRQDKEGAKFLRYREALDTILGKDAHRASVHFLQFMVEAYYFGDPDSVKQVTGVSPTLEGVKFAEEVKNAPEHGNIEGIRHPKSELKKQIKGFKGTTHGHEICNQIDMDHVLHDPRTCASLRTLFVWCTSVMREPLTERFCLTTGVQSVLTGKQVEPWLPESPSTS